MWVWTKAASETLLPQSNFKVVSWHITTRPHFHVQQDFFSGAKNITDSSNECNGIHATSEWNSKLNAGVINLNVYPISITEGFYRVATATILLGDFKIWKEQNAEALLTIGTEVGVLADHVVGISGFSALGFHRGDRANYCRNEFL